MLIAVKDNQNPGDITESGLINKIIINTRLINVAMEVRRLAHTKYKTMQSMSNARCVGTENPASAAYIDAAIMEPNAATTGAENFNEKLPVMGQSQRISKNTSPATKPMCKPDMAKR